MKLHEEILFSRILVYSEEVDGYDELVPWSHEVFIQYTDEGEIAHAFGMAKNSELKDVPDLTYSELMEIKEMITKSPTKLIKWKRSGGKICEMNIT